MVVLCRRHGNREQATFVQNLFLDAIPKVRISVNLSPLLIDKILKFSALGIAPRTSGDIAKSPIPHVRENAQK